MGHARQGGGLTVPNSITAATAERGRKLAELRGAMEAAETGTDRRGDRLGELEDAGTALRGAADRLTDGVGLLREAFGDASELASGQAAQVRETLRRDGYLDW